ncbi:RING finger and transmembrane domain-containing protein 2 isoform X2 [Abrus precatorius]|uniref:RING finger and transmembrane domain-containing protein 2 isoform X2 n=1 Tax=Abrus precatorius TaxID=3816 RepID=A0A8B8L1T4_ABRPR|nr:RING finger and transmembrane domain-containing protein 2 isoform X2 [Abrus precatorius]
MEGNGDMFRASSPGVGPSTSSSSLSSASRRYGILSASNIIQAPLSVLLEYSGILPSRSNHHSQANPDAVDNDGEVSIRIIGPTEHEHQREEQSPPGGGLVVGLSHSQNEAGLPSSPPRGDVEGVSQAVNGGGNGAADAEAAAGGGDGVGPNGRDSSYQRYDIQHAARWIEQVLPFSLLLLVVFIRQHLQGFFVTIWIAAVLFKSNDILRKQTALKGERKIPVLIGISVMFALHVVGVYWWYQNDDIMYPLIMLPPKDIPPFWHAIFIIMVNDTLVRQAAMVFKCMLLMYYKNSRGRNYRKQGQMLTLVEYLLLLYRALLPTPVWYRFFLNKEYGSLFSSLMTGLYLTFKLTSVVEKVQSFFAAVKALSRKEVHYGAYATSEQVNAAGDLCAICQEKMHAPILLRCKHIFCEDCVSEWFERERTCPLCRALVKPADLRSFGDGSTSLFFQLF